MKRLDVPVLIIHGDQDGIVPIRNAQWLYSALPRAIQEANEPIFVAGASHARQPLREMLNKESNARDGERPRRVSLIRHEIAS